MTDVRVSMFPAADERPTPVLADDGAPALFLNDPEFSVSLQWRGHQLDEALAYLEALSEAADALAWQVRRRQRGLALLLAEVERS